MGWLIGIICVLFIVYSCLIIFYTVGWKRIPTPIAQISTNPLSVRFSIIIPARNEEKNIIRLLSSIQQQSYPPSSFEIIVVDDHSEDLTAPLVNQFIHSHDHLSIRLITLQDDGINSYKKKAIEAGVAAAKNEWIVSTDADCIVPPNWLLCLARLIEEKDPVFIAAPVSFLNNHSLLSTFQSLDFITLQGITGASVYKKIHAMCNGANLAYQRKIFYEVNGFEGIDKIASGDDMLLMHKIWQKYPERVLYLKSKEVIVETNPAETWKAFFNQRIRWASKATSYDDKRITAVLFVVYFFNFSFLLLWIMAFFYLPVLYVLLAFWILKTIVEWPFVNTVARFFSKQSLMRTFFFFQPLHIAYTILAGLLGSFGTYEWKGRKVK